MSLIKENWMHDNGAATVFAFHSLSLLFHYLSFVVPRPFAVPACKDRCLQAGRLDPATALGPATAPRLATAHTVRVESILTTVVPAGIAAATSSSTSRFGRWLATLPVSTTTALSTTLTCARTAPAGAGRSGPRRAQTVRTSETTRTSRAARSYQARTRLS
jgi:hypothetical protein